MKSIICEIIILVKEALRCQALTEWLSVIMSAVVSFFHSYFRLLKNSVILSFQDMSTKYVTTNKSTREAIKKLDRDGEKPSNVYKHMTKLGVGEDTSVAEIMVKLPRNHREVVNLKKTKLDKDRRSHDSFYTMLAV